MSTTTVAPNDSGTRKRFQKWDERAERRHREHAQRLMREHPAQVAEAEAAKSSLRDALARRQMYNDDAHAYDFGGELEEALQREALRARARRWWKIESVARGGEFDAAAVRKLTAMVCPEAATVAALLRHARKFGADGVYDTAVLSGLPADELHRVRVDLTLIARAQAAKQTKQPKQAKRQTPDATANGNGRIRRAEVAAALRDRGRTTDEIAVELAVSFKHAQRLLAESELHQLSLLNGDSGVDGHGARAGLSDTSKLHQNPLQIGGSNRPK
jgi:hypothetical protein